jgi:hypothetical protein
MLVPLPGECRDPATLPAPTQAATQSIPRHTTRTHQAVLCKLWPGSPHTRGGPKGPPAPRLTSTHSNQSTAATSLPAFHSPGEAHQPRPWPAILSPAWGGWGRDGDEGHTAFGHITHYSTAKGLPFPTGVLLGGSGSFPQGLFLRICLPQNP